MPRVMMMGCGADGGGSVQQLSPSEQVLIFSVELTICLVEGVCSGAHPQSCRCTAHDYRSQKGTAR